MELKLDTQEVKTPSGEHTILAKSYLTGEDRRKNRRTLLKLGEEGVKERAELIEAGENALMQMIILEINGRKEGDAPIEPETEPFSIVRAVEKMRAGDYDFVIDLVNEVAAGLDKKKEQTSGGNTKTSSEEEK